MAEGRGHSLRILHLTKTSVGASWALRQMRELVNLGLEVHVAIPTDGPLIPQYRAAGITVHPGSVNLPMQKPWRWPIVLKRMRSLVSRIKPQLIHSHHVGTTLTMRFALGKGGKVPRIFQVPGPLHLEYPWLRRAEIVTAGGVDYWIASCNKTADLYRQSGVLPGHLFLSYYGTEVDAWRKSRQGKLRRYLHLGDNVKIVGMVAFMYAPKRYLMQTRGIKGHEDLIDAVALCLKAQPNVVAVFIGGAWAGAKLYEMKIRAYGEKKCGKHAVFLGTRDDVFELYPDFDVAVHPSHSENVGGAVESFLLGVPTIATSVGGLPDLVKENETGWLVPPRRPDLLAKAILDSLNEPENGRARAIRGQALARNLFDVRRTAYQVSGIYRQIVG